MESQDVGVLRKSRTADKSTADEDLDMRILIERLRLLDNQRRMQAASCQRFTDMMEAALLRHSSQGSQTSPNGSHGNSHAQHHQQQQQQRGQRGQSLTERRHSSTSCGNSAPRPCAVAPCAALCEWPKGAKPVGVDPFQDCESSDDDGERYWTQPCCSSPRRRQHLQQKLQRHLQQQQQQLLMLPQQGQGQGQGQGCLQGSSSDCSSLSQDAWEVQQYYQAPQPSARRKSQTKRCMRRQRRSSFGL